MSIALNGSTGYLSLAQKIASSYPFSLAIWVAGSTGNDNQAAICQSSSSSSRYAMGWLTSFGDNKNASYQNVAFGASSATKNTAPDLSPTTMRLLIVVFESATSRRVYFGSNSPATDTSNLVDETTNHNQLLIGTFQSNGNANNFFLQGSVAEASVYGRALDATDYDSLAAGTLGETLANCLAQFPLQTATDLTSTNGTYTLTANGGVTTSGIAHPVSRSAATGGGPLTGGLTRSTLTQGRLVA